MSLHNEHAEFSMMNFSQQSLWHHILLHLHMITVNLIFCVIDLASCLSHNAHVGVFNFVRRTNFGWSKHMCLFVCYNAWFITISGGFIMLRFKWFQLSIVLLFIACKKLGFEIQLYAQFNSLCHFWGILCFNSLWWSISCWGLKSAL